MPLFSKVGRGVYCGPYAALREWDLLWELGVRDLTSIVPVARVGVFQADHPSLSPRPLLHRVFFSWDDTVWDDPLRVDLAINGCRPIFIHCNSGQNRSTALAACRVLRDMYAGGGEPCLTEPPFDVALTDVIGARQETLGHPPKVYPEMFRNVQRYSDWFFETEVRR